MPTDQAVVEKPTIAEELKPQEEILPAVEEADWIIRRPKRAKVSAEEAIRRT